MSDLLLVDNDPRIADLLAFFLKKRGHVVRTAKSFTEARAELAVRAPDLMLSDLDLGRERGDEELPRLAREGLLPPTLIVSGYLDSATERALTALPGVVGTLRKPFDLSTLETRVQRALDDAAHARVKRELANSGAGIDPQSDGSDALRRESKAEPSDVARSQADHAEVDHAGLGHAAAELVEEAGWTEVAPHSGGRS